MSPNESVFGSERPVDAVLAKRSHHPPPLRRKGRSRYWAPPRGRGPSSTGIGLDGRGWADAGVLLADQHRVFQRFPVLSSGSPPRRSRQAASRRAAGRLEHCPHARRALAEACDFGCRTTARAGRPRNYLSKSCAEVCVLSSPCDETRSREARHLRLARERAPGWILYRWSGGSRTSIRTMSPLSSR
jgi:hypothetical protein